MARSVALQSDGKVIVAGTSYNPSIGQYDFGLARLATNGVLDTTFGSSGKVTTDFFGSYEEAWGVVVSGTDILVAGHAYNIASGSSYRYDFAVAKYDSSGALDSSFDADGKVTTDITGHEIPSDDYAYDLTVQQSDGKTLVAGRSYSPYGSNGGAVVRYNVDGSLDTTFGEDGQVLIGALVRSVRSRFRVTIGFCWVAIGLFD